MNDNKFDDFVNNRLNEYAAPVPAGLWEKVAEGQFDQFIGSKLRDAEAPVPEGLWEKITDNQFDNFVSDKFDATEAPVPEGLWDKITDGQFDSFVAGKLDGAEAAVPTGLWDKITDGQFDNFVAGKLTNYEAPVPAGLWEKVRPGEDDDRVGFFWFRYPAAAVLLLAILTAAAWGGYVYFSKKNIREITQSVTPKTNGAAGDNKTTAQGSPKATDNAGPASPSTAVPDANNNAPAGKSPVTDPSADNNKKSVPAPGAAITSKDNKTNGDANRLNGTAANPERSSANTANTTDNNRPSINRLAPPPSNNDITTNSYDLFKNKNGVSADKGNDQTAANNDDNIRLEPFQRSFSPANTVPFGLNFHPASDKQLSTINHTNQFKSVIICPGDKGGNKDWLVEVYASPEIAMKSVSNVSASPAYLLRKDSSESMQIGYSAGVRFVKPVADNILLKAGIQYTQANEKYVYRTENEVKTTTVVTVRTIIRGPGDTVIVHDTSTLQTIGFKNNIVNNRYRSIDIPITVGYQFGDDDLKFGINAGAVLNLTSWYQGVILDSSLATVTLNKTGNMVYKTQVGLGLYAGVSVVKKLGEDMSVFAEPYFRYNLSNMTTPQAGFKQKLNFGGISFGLRFNLNRK